MQPKENKSLVLRHPLLAPAINPRLEELNAITRSTECLRFFVLSTEHWISPNGRLRWWIKLNVYLAAWLFIPAILLMPVISLVLHEVDGWLSVLLRIAIKFILLSILVFVTMRCSKHCLKHFPSSSTGSSRRRK